MHWITISYLIGTCRFIFWGGVILVFLIILLDTFNILIQNRVFGYNLCCLQMTIYDIIERFPEKQIMFSK